MSGSAVLLARLRRLTPLSEADLSALAVLLDRAERIEAGRRIVAEGETATHVDFLMQGWAVRQQRPRAGRPAFSAFLVAGDICNIAALRIARMEYGVTTLTACRIARVARGDLIALAQRSPALPRVLAWLTAVDTALLGRWLPPAGRTTARQRLGHLFCELMARLSAVGCAAPDGFDMPLTQRALAGATGLSPPYVNRVLHRMRDEGLIAWRNGRVTIVDRAVLEAASAFSPAYLQLDGIGR